MPAKVGAACTQRWAAKRIQYIVRICHVDEHPHAALWLAFYAIRTLEGYPIHLSCFGLPSEPRIGSKGHRLGGAEEQERTSFD